MKTSKERIAEIRTSIYDLAENQYRKNCEAEERQAIEHNGNCPHCQSTKINDRIRNVEGNCGGFFGGGHIYTVPVNKCNDCGHEWKKFSYSGYYPSMMISSELREVGYDIDNGLPIRHEQYRGIPISLFRELVEEHGVLYYGKRNWMRKRVLLRAGFIR
jgi:hypothetical protein